MHRARHEHPDDEPGEHARRRRPADGPGRRGAGRRGASMHPPSRARARSRCGSGRVGHECPAGVTSARGRVGAACLDSGRGRPDRAHPRRGGAPRHPRGGPPGPGVRTMRVGVPRRGQEPGVPGRAHPGGGDRAGARRARGARRAGRGRGLLHPGRRLHRRGRADRRRAPTTSGPTPTCCSRSRSRSPRSTTGCARGQTLFTYLHLAASKECTDALVASGTTAIAYETVQTADGALPLLAPMSEVAGRMAPQVGAHSLERAHGGRGVLLGGVSGVYAAKVVVIGAGVSGMNAAAIALGMQAEVVVLDRDIDKLRAADRIYQGHLQTVASNAYEVERAVLDADLVIGAVLVAGRQGADADQQRAGQPDEAGLGARRHRRRPGRLLRGHPARPRTTTRRSGCTTRSSTAWPTCPARCRTPRRTR